MHLGEAADVQVLLRGIPPVTCSAPVVVLADSLESSVVMSPTWGAARYGSPTIWSPPEPTTSPPAYMLPVVCEVAGDAHGLGTGRGVGARNPEQRVRRDRARDMQVAAAEDVALHAQAASDRGAPVVEDVLAVVEPILAVPPVMMPPPTARPPLTITPALLDWSRPGQSGTW